MPLALRKPVLALETLQSPVSNAPQPEIPEVNYIGLTHLLRDSLVNDQIMRGVANLAIASMQASQQEQDANLANAVHVFHVAATLQIGELPDESAPLDAEFFEAEGDDENDEVDEEIYIAYLKSTIGDESAPVPAPNLDPVQVPLLQDTQLNALDKQTSSPVHSLHEDDFMS